MASRVRRYLCGCACFLAACGGGSSSVEPPGPPPPPPPPPPPARTPVAAAANVIPDDVANAGNASDIEVTFDGPGGAGISAVRIILRRVGDPSLSADDALLVAANRFAETGVGSGRVTLRLPATLRDANGNEVRSGERYDVMILSVPSDAVARVPAIVSAAHPLTLAVTTVKLTYLWNAGVMIEDDTASVVIDALQRRTDGFFIDPPLAAIAELEAGVGPFARVRLALGTHFHEDHIIPAAANAFLNAVPSGRFIGPPSLVNLLAPSPRTVAPQLAQGVRMETTVGGIAVTVLSLRHFNAFNTDFGAVENFGYILRLGGKSILHVGDADLTVANLARFGLHADSIDVAIVPAWGELVSASRIDAVIASIAPRIAVATHTRRANLDDVLAASLLYPAPVIVLTTPLYPVRF